MVLTLLFALVRFVVWWLICAALFVLRFALLTDTFGLCFVLWWFRFSYLFGGCDKRCFAWIVLGSALCLFVVFALSLILFCCFVDWCWVLLEVGFVCNLVVFSCFCVVWFYLNFLHFVWWCLAGYLLLLVSICCLFWVFCFALRCFGIIVYVLDLSLILI